MPILQKFIRFTFKSVTGLSVFISVGLMLRLINLTSLGKETEFYSKLSVPTNNRLSRDVKPVCTTAFVNSIEETQHIAFLKVHKAASSTTQNILYRFGFARNLSFVLPMLDNYFSKQSKYVPKVLKPLNGKKHDILCNHAVFNYTVISSYLKEDSVYIGIIRDPLSIFISAANYYRYVWNDKYLKKIPEKEFLHQLINNPRKYEPKHTFLSQTYNRMAFDFGFDFQARKRGKEDVDKYLQYLNEKFSLVMLAEYVDESLVLMKRLFKWKLRDIIYLSKNEFTKNVTTTISSEDINVFKKRNFIDYIFYDFFHKRFWNQITCHSPAIFEEVRHFKSIQKIVKSCCKMASKQPCAISESVWNEKFYVADEDCRLMSMPELDFFKLLKKRHKILMNKLSVKS
ncbi:hypothetical protein CHS0354_009633 [Potamilus streckersoni]|uniref:Galactosylceramide sulfotransferase-like n=1 Tax=Potamilus streckersoni TaxID=2493646 RepID=A0AAE0S4C9_9BIVA|nr:hypothetical protein CHS0354_009633 [Potamilus streckersoni]